MPEENDINIEGIYWGSAIAAILITLTAVYEAVTMEGGVGAIALGIFISGLMWAYHGFLCWTLQEEWREKKTESA